MLMIDNTLDVMHACHLFLDYTEEEFRQKYLTKEWDPKSRRGLMKAEIPHVKDLPKEFDWRNLSAVSPVKNQVTTAPLMLCKWSIIN